MGKKASKKVTFDLDCRRCERLSTFLDQVSEEYPDYHARPVEPFGDDDPDLLIVGLAPGMHGVVPLRVIMLVFYYTKHCIVLGTLQMQNQYLEMMVWCLKAAELQMQSNAYPLKTNR